MGAVNEMASDPKANPYAAALADLRAKRAKIDNTIRVLEELSGLTLSPGPEGELQFVPASADNGIEETAGMFLGMSIADAARKLLNMRKRTLGNVDIARELQEGGMAFKSKDPVNVVGSVLTRRFNEVGDIVKVGRGIWGLKEWYPGRNFKQSKPSPENEAFRDAVIDRLTNPARPVSTPSVGEPESGAGAVDMD